MSFTAIISRLIVLIPLLAASFASGEDSKPAKSEGVFKRENLVAWCIVPFDGKKRTPAQRAAMVKRLGLSRVAYDWRAEHVESFEEEILQYQKHGIEYFAFWGAHPDAQRLFKKYKLRPQIWQTLRSPAGENQQQRVIAASQQLVPLVKSTRELGCKLGLYNHGGWGGEPANMVAVCKHLRETLNAEHVGIVYNQHHAHNRIDDFASDLKLLKPYLLCLNLNGMDRNGDQQGKKILPLGEGEFDVELMKAVRNSGYAGPIGIIGHTQDDVEQRLQDNLDGLDWILPQLDGKPAGPKPRLRTWSPIQKDTAKGTRQEQGLLLAGKPEYRKPPITVECRVTVSDRNRYNIFVASDAKSSGAHWELFSMNGTGTLTAYMPGVEPDHVRSKAMICDGQPHTLTMLYEATRVRLLVDGRPVADQKIATRDLPTLPGKLGIGKLVKQALDCSGKIHWVRISKGIRDLPANAVRDVAEDDDTLLVWHADSSSLGHHGGTHKSESNRGNKYFSGSKAPEYSSQLVEKIVVAAREGNGHRGLLQFSSAQNACLSCHRLGKFGGDVGPDIAKLAPQRKAAEIVESVIWPKRHVDKKYVAQSITTVDGKSYRGYVVRRDNDWVVLRDPTKPIAESEFRIARDEIDEEAELGSLMPDNLLAAMSTEQINDLFRFLFDLGSERDISESQKNSILEHALAHANGPATFPFDRKPLQPKDWPSWQHEVNRDRVYDFYRKQAQHFRAQRSGATLLAEHPGLDGGRDGHWGNQDDTDWEDDRWNDSKLGAVQCGIFRGGGVTVPRGVNVRLGDRGEMSACFNPDTLTYDAVWTGGFVKYSSRRHGFMHGTQMAGKLVARAKAPKPSGQLQYHGYYRRGKRTIFAYRIGDIEYLDSPWVDNGEFVRQVAPADQHPLAKLISPERSVNTRVETLETDIHFGSQSPYAIDTIELPFENAAKSLMFVGGLAFQADGTAMFCTIQGDVWRVNNLLYPSKRAQWQRFATGLNHALGMVIDDDGIFVLGRDQITRLHDQNQDGEADYYECFSKAFETSVAGHDFICGLQRDKTGNFYTASGNQGIVQITPDGKRATVIATGFRNPDGLGMLPDGTVTVPCSEGTWTPASMICAVRPGMKGSYYGFGGPVNGKAPELPMAYVPRSLDNSSGGQVAVESNRWGPLDGQIVHMSFGMGRHFLVLRDEVDGQLQGAVVPLPGEFRSGSHRARFNPADGQLYVGGMQGWASWTTDDGCLQRVRYTGENVQLPIGFRVHENGVVLEFSEELEEGVANKAGSHFAQCWNYRYSGAYGSPELSTQHIGMRGHDRLAITSAHVLTGRRKLFLEIPDLQPVNQLHLLVKSNSGVERQLFVTVHKLAKPFTDFSGYKKVTKTIRPHPIVADLAMATRSVPNPFRNKIPKARKIRLETGTNLSFATRTLRARAGEVIEFSLHNPDVVPHNWALLKPGTLQRVGEMANRLISDPEAAIRHYIPASTDILAHTNVVLPKETGTIYFRAPNQPGRYPFLCTFPGHWMIMNGNLVVEPDKATE